MELKFRQSGPEREVSIELPPQREFLADYVLVYDRERKRTIYLASPDFHQLGHAWAFDGESFEQISDESLRTESPSQRWQGVYDASRRAVVAWNFGKDDDYEDTTYGVVLGAEGPKLLEAGGDQPKRKEGADETGGSFAYDERRDVTVCMTALGVWELSADGTWTKKHDGEGVPKGDDWKEQCVGAAWDAKTERSFFYFVCEDDTEEDRLFLYAWDGETLTLLSNEGMPEDLITGWMNTGPVLVSHPDGVVAQLGWDQGAVIFDGRWIPWGVGNGGRPASAKALMTWDENIAAFVAGPGRYEPAPGEYPEDQHVFYVSGDSGFQKLGITEKKSEISELWAKRFGAFLGGRYLMMGNYYLTLIEWTDEGWNELIDKKAQKGLWDGGGSGNDTYALTGFVEDGAGTVLLVANEGQVFALEDEAWVQKAEGDTLWKKRMWTALCWDQDAGRIVAWGGRTRGRKSNQTLFFDPAKSAWKKAKKSSPQPKGFARGSDDSDVEYQLVFDHGLRAVVRIGWEEAAALDGELWKPVLPPKMGELNSVMWRAVASDPKSGETLIVNFESGAIFRFDLGGCEQIGTFELPDDLRLGHTNDDLGYRVICDDWAFDPDSRALHVQNDDDAWGHYVLDLGEAFDAAAELGARTLVDGVVESRSAALYRVTDEGAYVFFAETEGKAVHIESGAVGAQAEAKSEKAKSPEAAIEKLDAVVADAKKDGFVTAGELDEGQLRRLACVPMRTLTLGAPPSDDVLGSHLGGRPAEASLDTWPTTEREVMQQLTWHLPEELNFFEVPEEQREDVMSDLRDGSDPDPLGLLVQLETGDLLQKHGAIAVYVDTSGVATESMLHNRVRLISKEDSKGAASCEPAAPVLDARAIEIGEPTWEVDAARATALTQRDPELAAALEALDLPPAGGYSKMGGAPTWVQHSRTILGKGQVPYRFVMQLDFDSVGGLKDSWPDAGLFGVLYVFVNEDETAACAFWQYT